MLTFFKLGKNSYCSGCFHLLLFGQNSYSACLDFSLHETCIMAIYYSFTRFVDCYNIDYRSLVIIVDRNEALCKFQSINLCHLVVITVEICLYSTMLI